MEMKLCSLSLSTVPWDTMWKISAIIYLHDADLFASVIIALAGACIQFQVEPNIHFLFLTKLQISCNLKHTHTHKPYTSLIFATDNSILRALKSTKEGTIAGKQGIF